MYMIRADGVVIYNPALDNATLQVLKPHAKMKLGSAGSLTFTMPPTNVMYGKLQVMKSVVTLEQSGEIIFRGRVLDTVVDIDKNIEVYCEGALNFLMDSAVRPYTYEGGATGLFHQLVAQHNAQVESFKQFTVGSVSAASGETMEEFDSDACANTLNEIKTMLVDPYGGYLRARYSGSAQYLDYVDAYGTASSQALEYGVNIVALEDAYEAGNIYSVLVPLGAYYTEPVEKEEEEGDGTETASETEGETAEGETPEEEVDETIGEDGLKKKLKVAGMVTIEEVNGGSDCLIDSDMLAKYGRIVKTVRFEGVEDPQELMDKAQEMMARNKDARSIRIRAVDLHVINAGIEKICLGDSVRLVSSPHGLSLTDVCSEVDLDCENPEFSEYTFGIPRESLTEQNASASRRSAASSSSFLRWLTETDTSLNIAVQNVDLINGKLTQVGIDVDALEGAVTLYAQRIDGLDTQLGELKVKYDEIYAKVTNNEGDIAQLRIDVNSITSRVEDAEGNISILQQTAEGLTLDISNLQGDVAAIKVTAEELSSKFTNLEGDMSEIRQTAEEISLKVENAEGDIASLKVTAEQIEGRVTDVEGNFSTLTQTVDSIEGRVESVEGNVSTLTLTAEQIEGRVKSVEGDVSTLTQTADSITARVESAEGDIAELSVSVTEQGSQIAAKADLFLLKGYVKADELETEVLTILEYAWADSVDVQSLVAASVNTEYLSADSITTDSLSVGGESLAPSTLTMGTTSATLFAPADINLAHSHKVTDNGDGTFTLGEVSSTGGSFNIADTKYYKDGVSAAKTEGINSVTLSGQGWTGGSFTVKASNGQTYQVSHPTVSISGGTTWNASHQTTVYAYSNAVSGYLTYKTIDASSVYDDGANSVTLSAGEWASNKMTVTASNGKTLEVDASSIYSSGVSTGYTAGYNQAITGALIELDGSTVKVYSPDGGTAGPTLDISSNLTASYNSGYSDATPMHASYVASYRSADNTYPIQVTVVSEDGTRHVFDDLTEIDASAAYDAGYKAATDSATLTVDGTNVVVTFSDGTTKSIDVTEYVTAQAEVSYVGSTSTTITVRGWGRAYFNSTLCESASDTVTYDTAD